MIPSVAAHGSRDCDSFLLPPSVFPPVIVCLVRVLWLVIMYILSDSRVSNVISVEITGEFVPMVERTPRIQAINISTVENGACQLACQCPGGN